MYILFSPASFWLPNSQLSPLILFYIGLLKGLRLNRTLLYLSLANNHIGDVGASHLAQVHLQTFLHFYSLLLCYSIKGIISVLSEFFSPC